MISTADIAVEYTKCVMDPKYAIETYFMVYHKQKKGYVPYKLFPKQKEIIDGLINHRFNIVTKPRQAGVSTTSAAFFAVQLAFADPSFPQHVLTIANNKDMAQEFLSKIKEFLEQVPRWVWGEEFYGTPEKEKKSIFVNDSKGYLELPNGSTTKAVSSSKTASRGYAPTYLVFDEAAFIDEGEIVYGAAVTSLGAGGGCLLISTPNGLDSLYYKTFDEARKKENTYNVIEMMWYQDCRYNKGLSWIKGNDEIFSRDVDEWSREWVYNGKTYFLGDNGNYSDAVEMIKGGWKPKSPWYVEMCGLLNNNARLIAQELDVSFIGSGGNVIEDEWIEFQEKNNVQEPNWYDGEEKEIWIWEKPQIGHEYILSADVSSGSGADSSTFSIIDITTMTQVVEYKGKIQPDLFAKLIYEWGNMYNALTVIDITGGWGVATVLKLIEMKYEHLHYEDSKGQILKAHENLSKHNKGSKLPGLIVNSIRNTMVHKLEQCVRENTIKIRSRRCTGEMRTFIYKNGRPDHMSGFNDDCLMALAMGLWIIEYSFKEFKKLESLNKAMLANWSVGSPVSSVTNGFSPKKGVTTGRPKFSPQVSKNMQDPNGDYLWLFSGLH